MTGVCECVRVRVQEKIPWSHVCVQVHDKIPERSMTCVCVWNMNVIAPPHPTFTPPELHTVQSMRVQIDMIVIAPHHPFPSPTQIDKYALRLVLAATWFAGKSPV